MLANKTSATAPPRNFMAVALRENEGKLGKGVPFTKGINELARTFRKN
jgi:hypothetical protein